MKKITVDDIIGKNPCTKYTTSYVTELWGGRESLTLCEILDLHIPVEDRIWAVTQLIPEKEARLFAADCAALVLHLWVDKYPDDNRPAAAISAARDYAEGRTSSAASAAASSAARAAARDAASSAARAAASAAARAAARAAYWAADSAAYLAAARAAYWAADWAADSAAEQTKQLDILRGYCAILEKDDR